MWEEVFEIGSVETAWEGSSLRDLVRNIQYTRIAFYCSSRNCGGIGFVVYPCAYWIECLGNFCHDLTRVFYVWGFIL